jgi:adenine-specific DNA-methyltransferase
MSYQRLRPTFTFDADRLAQLRAVVPEAFADGQINWEALRAALGEHLEDESADAEHFGLFWPGKRAARRRASEPPRGTLIPVSGAGVDEETTRNLFIEADNLEALKLLQKAYAGRVKMIYIDPPYNTGNDFVYRDDFREAAEDYLRRTGQVDERLRPLTTNPRTGGRFHSNWLNMMYPRLLLARTLLRDDGVIFVSIDDNEVANLRLIMDEIFGAENFVAQLIWRSRQMVDNRSTTGVSIDHEYITVYRKTVDVVFTGSEKDLSKFSNPDNDSRGPWRSADLTGLATKERRPNLHYDLIDPVTKVNYGCPPKGWRYDPETMARKIAEGRILFPENSEGRPRHKLFQNEMQSLFTGFSSILAASVFTLHGTRELKELFAGEEFFSFPKPTDLIRLIIRQIDTSDDIILDFFAGSGTTAHAVMAQNAEDGGSRQFILVQLPEETGRADYPTISAICAERIRRAGRKIAAERAARLPDPDAAPLDVGFRFLRFAPSHFKAWQDYEGDDLAALQLRFDQFETPLVDGWRAENLLTEVMLQLGFPLDSRVEPLPEFDANAVVRVSSDFHAHRLYACFDAAVAQATIDALTLGPDDLFVCLDSALTDEAKARLADACNLRTI